METFIENDFLRLRVNRHGAEMVSLVSLSDNTEYLWQADAKHWARHAPLLFPIVGRLKDNQFITDGHSYLMPQHGFARDSEFELIQHLDYILGYRLRSNAQTLHQYPFGFELHVVYELAGNAVKVRYEVYNTGVHEMYFSIGAHPAFNINIRAGEKTEDYFLEFETEETAPRYLLKDGLLAGQDGHILQNEKMIALSEETFAQDALIFKHPKSKYVTLQNKKGTYRVKVSLQPFPFLGIWSKKGAPFVCIEPWFGIADRAEGYDDIRHKEGIQALKPGDSFECEFTIEVGKQL